MKNKINIISLFFRFLKERDIYSDFIYDFDLYSKCSDIGLIIDKSMKFNEYVSMRLMKSFDDETIFKRLIDISLVYSRCTRRIDWDDKNFVWRSFFNKLLLKDKYDFYIKK